MLRLSKAALVIALAAAAPASAHADDADRYVLEKSGERFVRMDRETGDLSICEDRSGQLVCKLAADERSAFQDEIDRLQTTVQGLDRRVGKLENSLTAKLESSLPSEEDFQKSMSYMQRFLRGFMGVVRDMENDAGDPQHGQGPGKT